MRYEMMDCDCGICDICNGIKKIKSDYIRIDDSVEAILFIGKEVIFTNPDNYIWPEILYAVTEDGFEDVDRSNANEIKVHKSVVKAVCNNTRDRHILIWGICDPEVTEFIEWYHTGV